MAEGTLDRSSSGELSRRKLLRTPAIDGIRALGALLVFAYHMWQFSGSPTLQVPLGPITFDAISPVAHGYSGVDIFIVVSGLCLFVPYVDRDRRWSLAGYSTRRLFRIVPPYYAAIAVLVLLPQVLVIVTRAFGRDSSWQEFPSPGAFITHLTFTHTWFVDQWDSIQGAFWTIGLEAQLYIVFPIALIAYRKWGLRAIWTGIGLSILYRIVITPWVVASGFPGGFLLTVTVPGRWMQFGTGMLVAWLLHHSLAEGSQQEKSAHRTITGTPIWVWIPAAIVIYFIAQSDPVTEVNWFPLRDSLLAVATALLAIGSCLTPSRWGAPLRWRPVAGFGLISYSFYLLHQNTGWYMKEFGAKFLGLQTWLLYGFLLIVGGAFIGGLAYVFYRFIERPTTLLGKRTAQRFEAVS